MSNRVYNKPNKNVKTSNTNKKVAKQKYVLSQVFKNNIKLDELSVAINVDNIGEKSIESSRNNTKKIIGIDYPLIRINDYIFTDQEITSLEIDCTDFLPTMTFSAVFTTNIFAGYNAPKDGDILSIAIRNKNDKLRIIRADFIITSYIQSNKTTELNDFNPYDITIYAQLFIPRMDSCKFIFSHAGTSMEALQKIAKELNLGFVTNEDNTDDKQIWLCSYDTPRSYIQDTVQKSYKDDRSFYTCWIDIYYNLNFVNVDRLLLSSEDEFDIATHLSNTSVEYDSNENLTDKKKSTDTYKVLSNLPIYRNSSFFVSSWRPLNQAASILFNAGAVSYVQLYEHNDKLYQSAENKKYWNIKTEPSYDEQKLNNYIILRGRAKQKNISGNEQIKVGYNFVDLYETYPWMGIQYTISNPDDDPMLWDGNHHRNYMRARVQNAMNLKELDKLNIEADIFGTNSNIIRGDKIPLMILSNNILDNVNRNGSTQLDRFYSGWYMVSGYYINWLNDESGSLSKYSQTYILTRREWPTPVPIKKAE